MSHTAGLESDAVMGRSRVVARFDMGGKVLVRVPPRWTFII